MAAPRPLKIVKCTLLSYGLALFVTAPFTGTTAPRPAIAAAPVAPQTAQVAPGMSVDVLTFSTPVMPAEIMASLPATARVVSVSGRAADGRDSGFSVPDGMSLATALAMYGPDAAATPVVGLALAHDDAVLASLRQSFAGRLA